MSPNRDPSNPVGPGGRGAPPRTVPVPSSVARSLLYAYGAAWVDRVLGAAVLRAGGPGEPVEAMYVEPFAGADHPLPPGEAPLPVELLARVFARAGSGPSRARAVLLEEDPVKVDWLLQACRSAGLGERAGRVDVGGAPLEISLVEGGWNHLPPGAWPELEEARAALALVDPPNAGRLPLDSLESLLERQPAMDLALRFPIADLRRFGGFRGIPLADLPPHARRSVEGISRLLGDPRHQWAVAWRMQQAEHGDAPAETAVVQRLADRLGAMGGRRVRILRVDSNPGPEYLLVASAEPARLLLTNEVLFQARGAGWIPWPEEERDFVRFVPRAELELFGGAASARPAVEARDRVVDVGGLAHFLATAFGGQRVTLRGVLGSLCDGDLYADDVKRALGELRREGRALYRSLAQPDAEITFPRAGGARLQPRARQRRRTEDPGDLFLSLDPESDEAP